VTASEFKSFVYANICEERANRPPKPGSLSHFAFRIIGPGPKSGLKPARPRRSPRATKYCSIGFQPDLRPRRAHFEPNPDSVSQTFTEPDPVDPVQAGNLFYISFLESWNLETSLDIHLEALLQFSTYYLSIFLCVKPCSFAAAGRHPEDRNPDLLEPECFDRVERRGFVGGI
jgi:hypothetical protein